jgi:hypothetical protein
MSEGDESTGPQLIRVTDHVKISACVAFALSFLEVIALFNAAK